MGVRSLMQQSRRATRARIFLWIACAAAFAALAGLPVAAQTSAPSGDAGASSVEINEQGQPIAPPQTIDDSPADADVTSGTLRLLRALEAFHKNVKTVHAQFDQTRVDEVFLEKVKSEGELWFRKPDRFRADYADPEKLINLVVDEAYYVYVPKLEQAEIYRFASPEERDQQLHELLIGFGFKTEDLVERYTIRSSEDDTSATQELRAEKFNPEEVALFVVTPREAFRESAPFEQLKMYMDKAKLQPRRLWYRDKSNSSMTLDMKRIELDKPLADDLFTPGRIFAPGTEIIEKQD